MIYFAPASNVSSASLKIIFSTIFLVLILSSMIFAVRQDSTQSKIKKRTIRIERVETPDSAKTKRTETQQRSQDSPTETGVSTTSSVPCETVLFLGDVESVRLFAFNYPPNTTVTFTTAQTNPGIVGFAATAAGPFIPDLQFPVTMDGSGSGISSPYFAKGLMLGFTSHYNTSPLQAVYTPVDFNVIPQCNCPPIPIIP